MIDDYRLYRRSAVLLAVTLWFLPSLPTLARAEPTEVTFLYQPEEPVTSVSWASNVNGWDPDAAPMKDPCGDGVYEITVRVPDEGEIQYMFCVRARSRPGSTDWIADPSADRRALSAMGDEIGVVDVTAGGRTVGGHLAASNRTCAEYLQPDHDPRTRIVFLYAPPGEAEAVSLVGDPWGAHDERPMVDSDGDGIYEVIVYFDRPTNYIYQYSVLRQDGLASQLTDPSADRVLHDELGFDVSVIFVRNQDRIVGRNLLPGAPKDAVSDPEFVLIESLPGDSDVQYGEFCVYRLLIPGFDPGSSPTISESPIAELLDAHPDLESENWTPTMRARADSWAKALSWRRRRIRFAVPVNRWIDVERSRVAADRYQVKGTTRGTKPGVLMDRHASIEVRVSFEGPGPAYLGGMSEPRITRQAHLDLLVESVDANTADRLMASSPGTTGFFLEGTVRTCSYDDGTLWLILDPLSVQVVGAVAVQ